MTATMTPAVQSLLDSFRNLTSEEQDCFREEIAAGDHIIPVAHWEILMERERLDQKGKDHPVPAQEAFSQVRAELSRQRGTP